RACRATRPECVADIVADALRSGRLYVVADPMDGGRCCSGSRWTLELLPVRPSEVERLLGRNRATLPRDSGAPGRLYWLRRARYSSMASSGMWAMPCTMT